MAEERTKESLKQFFLKKENIVFTKEICCRDLKNFIDKHENFLKSFCNIFEEDYFKIDNNGINYNNVIKLSIFENEKERDFCVAENESVFFDKKMPL